MEDDPYMSFAQLCGSPDPADGLRLCEGTVRSVRPLTVSAFSLLFSGADVRVNAQLLSGWTQTVSISCPKTSFSTAENVTQGVLRAGDQVLCLTDGGKTLYVLAKVVSA